MCIYCKISIYNYIQQSDAETNAMFAMYDHISAVLVCRDFYFDLLFWHERRFAIPEKGRLYAIGGDFAAKILQREVQV